MSEVGVHGAADNLAANTTEFFYSVAEGNDLGGTHKCEVQGVEEEDQIFPWRTDKHSLKFKRGCADTAYSHSEIQSEVSNSCWTKTNIKTTS